MLSRKDPSWPKLTSTIFFYFCKQSGKVFFISGPMPSLGGGDWRYCKLLSLNIWLQCAVVANNLLFINNFNLFWSPASFFSGDGIYPSKLGSQQQLPTAYWHPPSNKKGPYHPHHHKWSPHPSLLTRHKSGCQAGFIIVLWSDQNQNQNTLLIPEGKLFVTLARLYMSAHRRKY